MFQNFIIPKLSNIGLVMISSQLRLDDGMIYRPLNERKCKICTTADIGDEYHYVFTCDFLRVTENYI